MLLRNQIDGMLEVMCVLCGNNSRYDGAEPRTGDSFEMKSPYPIEVESTIAAYRARLKSWTAVVAGIEPGDEAALRAEMDGMEPLLASFAKRYEGLAYSIDVLVNARRRSYASSEETRPERPPERGPR